MKPLEETWYVVDNGMCVNAVEGSNAEHCRMHTAFDDAPDSLAVARLAAGAPAMARMLLALEWQDGGCGTCGGSEHASDCAWLALMRAVGAR